MQHRIVPKSTIHLFVGYGLDRGAPIEFATNLMGSSDEPRHIIDSGNLFLLEQRHKLILLAWVCTCGASANNCGGQHHRDANQSGGATTDASAHGRIFHRFCVTCSTTDSIDPKRY